MQNNDFESMTKLEFVSARQMIAILFVNRDCRPNFFPNGTTDGLVDLGSY